MDHELLDQKADYFLERDDTYSSLKHEFSRIFHENNLQSLANASDFGFLELGKLASHGYSAEYEDAPRGLGEVDNAGGRPYQKEEISPYMGMGMHNTYSPMRFLQPNMGTNLNYGSNFQNIGSFVQDASYYQPMQSFKYPEYGLDYGAQQNALYSQNVYDMYNQSEIIDTHPNNPLSMMWSDDTNKGMNKASEPADDLHYNSQSGSNKRLASGPPQKQQALNKAPLKIEQDFASVSNKTLGLQIEKATKAAPESANSLGPRRTNRTTKPLYPVSAIKDDEDESGSDDEKDDAFGDAKNRSSRGLRVLSLKVRDIVTKKKKTSYKEVAEALLQDLAQKLKGKSQVEISKEEQNVKRRVYDALNVLIAAKILRKEGKLVCCETSTFGTGSDKKKPKNDKESLSEQIAEIKKRKKEKIEALQQLVFKNLALKNLIRRNMDKEAELTGGKNGNQKLKSKGNSQNVNATRIDLTQQNLSLDQKTQDTVSFPFIVVMSSCPENSMNLNMDASQKQFNIEAKKEFNIYGDIDVLLKMKLHNVPKQVFDKEIPKELQKYVSHSFVDALK